MHHHGAERSVDALHLPCRCAGHANGISHTGKAALVFGNPHACHEQDVPNPLCPTHLALPMALWPYPSLTRTGTRSKIKSSQLTSHRDHADEGVVRRTKAKWEPSLKMCLSVRRRLTFWITMGNEEVCPLYLTSLEEDAPRRDADGREQTWKAAWSGMFDSYRQRRASLSL